MRSIHPVAQRVTFIRNRFLVFSALAIGIAVLPIDGARAATPTFSSVFSFDGANGSNPNGKLLFDTAGNLYGTTYYGGANGKGSVFKLTPGADGFSITVLYSFTGDSDGAHPAAGLVIDKNGSLYGTASSSYGRPDGVVFQLKLTNGTYTFDVLHAFGTELDGAYPNCDLAFGPKGTLYGTTVSGGLGAGTVFELTPPTEEGASWTESVIYNFTGKDDGSSPYAGVVFDASGNLYGTASGGGTSKAGAVFELSPPAVKGGSWTETTLYDFTGKTDGSTPLAEVLVGSKGAIFGTTFVGGTGGGVVFELTPPKVAGDSYTETVLLAFSGTDGANPSDALIEDANGNLYGTSGGAAAGTSGNAFKLTAPAKAGGAFTEDVLYTFTGGADGKTPLASFIQDKSGVLYSTTFYGGAGGSGSVFKIK